MDDEVLVRVLDRRADIAEEPDPSGNGQRMLAGVRGDRLALDALHHEVRHAGVGAATIDQSHDVAVIERCEELTLVAEPGDRFGGLDRARQDLDRDASDELRVVTLRDVDGPHSPFADELADAVGAETAPDDVVPMARPVTVGFAVDGSTDPVVRLGRARHQRRHLVE